MAEPKSDRYDAVVIGAGIGGLTSGALMAQRGMRVLVLDQRPVPGGVCHSFRREGFTFDVGPHLLSNCGPQGTVGKLLRQLGVEHQVEFLSVNPLAKVVFPDFEVEIPPSYEAFTEILGQRFAEEKPRLRMLFREMQEVYEETNSLPSSFGLWDFLKVPVTHPVFMKYPNKTYGEMMDEFLMDAELKSILSALWVYFGLPPSEISAVFWSVVMMAYFLEGGYYPKGGIGKVAQALVKGLENQGGEFLPNTLAEGIRVRDGRVTGVELSDVAHRWLPDGRLGPEAGAPPKEKYFIETPTVVSNGDARRTFLTLVGEEHLSGKYVKKLHEMEPSQPLLKIALGVEMDVKAAGLGYHDTVFFDSYDPDAVYRRMQGQLPEKACDITIPSVTDPGLAPPGHHCLYLWNYVPSDLVRDWPSIEAEVTEQMIDSAEEVLPGLSAAIRLKSVMSPWTLHQYVLSSEGAPYGWTFTPRQMGFNRLQPRTPIKGLYLAGHWTTPGAGVAGVVLSGRNTAEIVVNEAESFYLWRKSA